MAYVTAITDRTQSDIALQNSKAYFNVADWVRIYGNSQEVKSHLISEFGASIVLLALTSPSTATIPDTTNTNKLLANIEVLRVWVVSNLGFYPTELDTEIVDDYSAGQNETSPNFSDVNRWENHLDLMYNLTLDGYYMATQNNDFVVTQNDNYLIPQ